MKLSNTRAQFSFGVTPQQLRLFNPFSVFVPMRVQSNQEALDVISEIGRHPSSIVQVIISSALVLVELKYDLE
ncbi:hypothetical protein EJB05_37585 [Eragrostis curvula]|uniref:Uncharacterized protein n=1 Tax=Eragrostis curvula TaxID=38414 RepID=A0A5J9TTJ3_9POAL|nr:hypothetical protein EJB05_37585 [Eragrostis curvula]